MKKLYQIDRLVEEVLDNKGYTMSVGRLKEKQLLMNLAKKCAEIDEEDFWSIINVADFYDRVQAYNSRLREGQVNLEPKQEEKPALQPLPEEMPEWFNTFCGANQKYNELRQHFGTQPREWWMDLKKGDKIIDETGKTRTFEGTIFLTTGKYVISDVSKCTPYTASPLDQLISTFTPEQKALWDAIKEGKDE